MANKKKTETPVTNSNVNNNTNINNIQNHIQNHINLDKSALEGLASQNTQPEKKESSWLTKAIVGGIITVAVSVVIYYMTGSGRKYGPVGMDNKPQPVEGKKVEINQ